jgi:hypothetical protein
MSRRNILFDWTSGANGARFEACLMLSVSIFSWSQILNIKHDGEQPQNKPQGRVELRVGLCCQIVHSLARFVLTVVSKNRRLAYEPFPGGQGVAGSNPVAPTIIFNDFPYEKRKLLQDRAEVEAHFIFGK